MLANSALNETMTVTGQSRTTSRVKRTSVLRTTLDQMRGQFADHIPYADVSLPKRERLPKGSAAPLY